MAEPQIDRQIFAAKSDPPRRHFSSMAGPLLLLAAVGVTGFAAYKFVNVHGVSETERKDPDLAQFERRLNEIEQRINHIENRVKVFGARPPTNPAREEPPITISRASSESADRISPATKPQSDSFPQANPSRDNHLSNLQQEFSPLRSDVSATREEWQATTDRLASVVGELGSQRREIARTRESLSQLSDRLDRSDLPFDLHKRTPRQRVGPVSLWLQSADPRNERYTIRLLVDDKWIELKDRALHEAVEFYAPGVAVPLELVVSEIGRDRVVGKLALPHPHAGVRR